MEYAIAALTVAIFAVIYALKKPKLREKFAPTYGEDEFLLRADKYIRSIPLPSDGGMVIDDKRMKRTVLRARLTLMYSKKCRFTEYFGEIFAANQKTLTAFCKRKYDVLEQMPAACGCARAVALAQFHLSHSHYIFTGDGAGAIISKQNDMRSLNADEISTMNCAYAYVLLQKLAFLCNDFIRLRKMGLKAKRYAAHHESFARTPIYSSLRKNKLFLYFVSEFSGSADGELKAVYEKHINDASFAFNNVLDSIKTAEMYDFTAHYSPLRYLGDFDAFSSADSATKFSFLKCMSSLAKKENLDESVYAARLCEFTRRIGKRDIRSRRISAFGIIFAALPLKSNDVTLSQSLLDAAIMRIAFSPAKRRGVSGGDISPAGAFSGVHTTCGADFGISMDGDHLTIKPHLSPAVDSASFTLLHKGVAHRITIEKGEETKYYIGDTELIGVPGILLKDRPLEIRHIYPAER